VKAAAARLAVRIAGFIEPARRAAWWADILYLQSRGRSGVREAASCLVSAPWLLVRRAAARPAMVGGLVCVTLALVVATGLEVQLDRARLYGQLDARLAADAQPFRRVVAPRVRTAADLRQGAARWLSELPLQDGESAMVAFDESFVVSAGSRSPVDALSPQQLEGLLRSKVEGWRTLSGRHGDVRALTVPVKGAGGTLVVTASRGAVDGAVAATLRARGTAAGAGLLVAALLLLLWARRVPPTPAAAAAD